jgi:hypothetical protein
MRQEPGQGRRSTSCTAGATNPSLAHCRRRDAAPHRRHFNSEMLDFVEGALD